MESKTLNTNAEKIKMIDKSGEGSVNPDLGIFIIGCPRSGTTLLRVILNSHHQLCAGEETGFLQEMENIVSHRWHQLEHFGLKKEEVLIIIRNFFLKFHHSYCNQVRKEIWVDKTPSYTRCLKFINELFPNCKIIHIIRDGRDVSASYREKWGKRGFFRSLREWVIYTRDGRAASEWLDTTRYHEVHYEELVNNTEMTLIKLIEFLNINWDESMLDHSLKNHVTSNKFAWERPIQAINNSKIGTWKDRLCWYEKILVTMGFCYQLNQLKYINTSGFILGISRLLEKVIIRSTLILIAASEFLDKIGRKKR